MYEFSRQYTYIFEILLLAQKSIAFHEPRVSMVNAFQEHITPEIGPYFDTTMPSSITGLAGDTVQLECRVKNLGNRTVKPVTEIAGGPDLYINKDSTINLTCYVKFTPEPPSSLTWSHNYQAINFDSPRGGISLVTEKGPVTSSRLLIQKASERDSGIYTCSPNNTHSISVLVHIVNEEHPAAMHHGSGDRMAATLLPVVLLLWMIF
ncbi:hypothetical protein ACFW04_005548 [Cataglyphis niger]